MENHCQKGLGNPPGQCAAAGAFRGPLVETEACSEASFPITHHTGTQDAWGKASLTGVGVDDSNSKELQRSGTGQTPVPTRSWAK